MGEGRNPGGAVVSEGAIRDRLRGLGDPEAAALAARYFKTGPGQYGEGDVFLGIRVPVLRGLAREYRDAPRPVLLSLLRSPVHEDRLLALLILVGQFQRGGEAARRRIYDLYLANTRFINNWDLVDTSARDIVGAFLATRDRAPLDALAGSESLWERRIAIIATFHFIRAGQVADTLRIAEVLLGDPEDLIHKAVGWMLREVGKRDATALAGFLRAHHRTMPRTMLRYAIERLPEAERRAFLEGMPASPTGGRSPGESRR
ncbi:DNA alkylation repair enzyme [Aquisphaera giovannonii]|uniref:DNA alkylation repair enzyme n=1 Tax=Aquisphaera giovannonii TaxID=406548 RepID=A0A5B9WD19_9BACT|nr:DNA alkylation repair protein [Aquisphaera giovannonii]QEH38129.1 DNA alkylation repair enzyme [Aquisphaera giovannonii]